MAKRIEVSDLNIYYGNFLAVEGVNVSIEPRSITALIGPSGCGKSTFLRSLNRMHEVLPGARVEGKVVMDGQDLYGADVDPVDVRRQIGMVFQRPNPFPTMSIYDNVVAGIRLNNKRMKKAEIDDLVEKSLRGANLWNEVKDRLDRPGSGLSGGQQQRLCIARAIAVEPDVLLMDEPCSALDPISTLAIEDLMTELKERFTIVIVTHNMQQAARVSEPTGFFNLNGVGPARPADRVQPDREDLQQPRREGHRGLHLRPLRLSRPAAAGHRRGGGPAPAGSRRLSAGTVLGRSAGARSSRVRRSSSPGPMTSCTVSPIASLGCSTAPGTAAATVRACSATSGPWRTTDWLTVPARCRPCRRGSPGRAADRRPSPPAPSSRCR